MSSMRGRLSDGLSRERIWLEMRRSRRPLLIYLAAGVVALACAIQIARLIGLQLPGQSSQTVRVAVDDASGVKPGLQFVRLHGLTVGRITGSSLHDGHAVLKLSIRGGYGTIYRNAQIRLRPATPLEDMYVDIVNRGTPSAGAAGDAVIPASQTQSPVDVGAVLNTFQAPERERLKELIDGLGVGLADRGQSLRAAIVELRPFLQTTARLTGAIARRGQLTRRLVHNARLLTDELAARDRELADLVARGSATLGATADAQGALRQTIARLPATMAQATTSMQSVRGALDAVDPALTAIRPAIAALSPALDTVRRLSTTARPALHALQTPVVDLVPLAKSLRPTAASLSPALASLATQAPRLDDITAQVVPCELAVQKFFQWTPSIFKFSDANGVVPRGSAVEGLPLAGGIARDPNQFQPPSCAKR